MAGAQSIIQALKTFEPMNISNEYVRARLGGQVATGRLGSGARKPD